MLCPYHAWTYDLTVPAGGPGVPRPRRVPTGRARAGRAAAGELARVPVRQRLGDALPFAEHVGALDELVALYQPGRLVPLASHAYDLACNWKVVLENYHECYHCPLIHPELCQVSPPASGDNFELDGAWVGGTMDLKDHAVTMSLDGHSDGVPIPGWTPSGCAPSPTSGCSRTSCSACTPTTS